MRAAEMDRAREACAVRDAWLAHGLSAHSAERAEAEDAVRELYRLIDAPAPRFTWVDSPSAGLELVRTDPAFGPVRLHTGVLPDRAEGWSPPSRLATLQSELRDRLESSVRGPDRYGWSLRPLKPEPDWEQLRSTAPREALAAGASLDRVLWVAVRDALRGSLGDAVRAPVRSALRTDSPDPLTWWGQHDASWVGHYDACARIGHGWFAAGDLAQLGLWARLARSTGWWWAGEGRCVMAERPAAVHTEPAPGAVHGEIRLHHDDGPAVRFRDGSGVYVLHGARVPGWVVTGPTVERIHAETNVEVRRAAIERIGWDAYIEQAGLRLVGTADDPGNPGFRLRLYDVPRELWGRSARLLLTVNGSVEPDGRRRQYALGVPAFLDDPVAAAGWSYGLSGEQYGRLRRRT
ncbi:DUF6745 domain-containing protein [Streptomyces purpureus]|uniref:DUF6745 domain-containing protein n=2 Tax=Streptomyces purpureus TaxID=1951 RepID=A0A918LN63_9ACTN|nr:hypothetical protein [Streptomyces purpureus]GGT24504.1 hypothetical protein GCM10014713_17030 [Streptomyces purpureus]